MDSAFQPTEQEGTDLHSKSVQPHIKVYERKYIRMFSFQLIVIFTGLYLLTIVNFFMRFINEILQS